MRFGRISVEHEYQSTAWFALERNEMDAGGQWREEVGYRLPGMEYLDNYIINCNYR